MNMGILCPLEHLQTPRTKGHAEREKKGKGKAIPLRSVDAFQPTSSPQKVEKTALLFLY